MQKAVLVKEYWRNGQGRKVHLQLTWAQRTWRKIVRAFKVLVAGSVIASVLYGAYIIGGVMHPTTVKVADTSEAPKIAQQMIQGKIDTLKAGVLNSLSVGCETKDVKEPDGAIILDTNNEMSIGRYMFQIKTVQHYYKQLYGQTISRSDAIKIAADKDKATQLASDIIFKKSALVSNWYNCSQKSSLNLVSRVNDIKVLEK